MLILIMNFGSQLLDRLEKSEKGRSKLRQAMDLVRGRLDEANHLQEQLRAAHQGCPPTHSQWTTSWQSIILIPPFIADLAHVRDQSEAASKRADEECQRAEAEKKKGWEQHLKVEGETVLREMRIQVAEQEAMTSTSRAISAERALAEATADRESLQTQVWMHIHTALEIQ